MIIQTPVYVSTSPDDGQGDKLRDAFIKINERFQDIASLMQNRGNWTTGTQYEPRDYILEGGEAYVCVIGHTAGVFATDLAAGKWASVDALDLRADLASTTIGKGAELVGFIQAGTGAVATTVQNELRDRVSVKQFGANPSASASENAAAIIAAVSYAGGQTVHIDEQINCAPLAISNITIDIEFSEAGKLIFAAQNGDDFVLNSCTGQIKNYRATHTGDLGGGSFNGLRLEGCNNFTVNGFSVDGSKDIPISIFDCDETKAINGKITGNNTLRRYAGVVTGSRNSGFQNCSATTVSFGFVILGAGYKSGGYTPPRSWENEQGMFIRDCSVYDHTGHAFDINGAVGATISRCVADTYTGTIGNSSFQIKNSTNIPEELEIDTRSSTIEHCVAINSAIGFSAQAIRGGNFVKNRSIRSNSYGLYLNDADFVVVDGIDIEDWCLSSTATGLNGETKVSAIGVASTSSDCSISGVNLRLKNTPYASNMRQIFAGGARTAVYDLKVQKISGASDVAEGVVVSGGSSYLAARVVPAIATLQLVDNSTTTQYEMSYGLTWAFSAGTSSTFDLSPVRGMVVGAVQAFLVSGTVSGHTWSIGRAGDNDRFILSRAVPATSEVVVPNGISQVLDGGTRIQAFGGSGTGTVTLNVIIGGIASV
jgi:hypothetical protein